MAERKGTRGKIWPVLVQLTIVLLFVVMAILRPFGAFVSWLIVLIALIAFVTVAGKSISGFWLGALIDERNRISLSRFQILAWTVLVLSALGTIAIARAAQAPATALDIGVPQTLWVLMGISMTSLIGSPLVRNVKDDQTLEPSDSRKQELKEDRDIRIKGQSVYYTKGDRVVWGDLFKGEEVGDLEHLDLGKIQMFFFTMLTLLGYGIAIGTSLMSSGIPEALPDLGSGFVALLGISHGGYLASKSVTATPPEDDGQ